jgi:hypothetical protein
MSDGIRSFSAACQKQESRSQKGQLTIVRSKTTTSACREPSYFLLLTSYFLLLTSYFLLIQRLPSTQRLSTTAFASKMTAPAL